MMYIIALALFVVSFYFYVKMRTNDINGMTSLSTDILFLFFLGAGILALTTGLWGRYVYNI